LVPRDVGLFHETVHHVRAENDKSVEVPLSDVGIHDVASEGADPTMYPEASDDVGEFCIAPRIGRLASPSVELCRAFSLSGPMLAKFEGQVPADVRQGTIANVSSGIRA